MKLLIDVDKDTWEFLKNSEENLWWNRGIIISVINGTPIPDDATNGDVIKIVTGEFYWEIVDEYGNHYMTDVDGNRFDMDWWNASYKGSE